MVNCIGEDVVSTREKTLIGVVLAEEMRGERGKTLGRYLYFSIVVSFN